MDRVQRFAQQAHLKRIDIITVIIIKMFDVIERLMRDGAALKCGGHNRYFSISLTHLLKPRLHLLLLIFLTRHENVW